MRIIKFRAWDKDEKVMRQVVDITFGAYQPEGFPTTLVLSDGKNNYSSTTKFCELMQFTGLKDKNSKEIYEGDIVKKGNKLREVMYSTEVKDSNKVSKFHAGWVLKCLDDDPEKYYGAWLEDYEVVGNIYENPELIK